jgi:hypothetical protein
MTTWSPLMLAFSSARASSPLGKTEYEKCEIGRNAYPLYDGANKDGLPVGRAAIVLRGPMGLLLIIILVAGVAGWVTGANPFEAESLRPDAGKPSLRDRGTQTVTAANLHALLSDPAIRDFKGLTEYSWDSNDPGALFGFDSRSSEADSGAHMVRP